MKLSDISSQKLSPGRYLITASYDGDIEYNPAEAQLVLTIDESGEAHIDVQPIDDEGAMQVVKVEPDISFTASTLDIVEKNLEEYPFDWKAYLSNPKDVPYSLYTSTGLELDEYQRLCWNASGTYILTLVTTETDLYLSKTINLTLNITAKVNPQIEYVNDNEQFTLENGNFIKRYRNIEKREGVFMFDLLQPTNPYGLPLKYKISDEKHGTIDTSDNKIYLSAEGKYKITAYYEGDDTYRSSITYYILKYYEGEEPEDDETEPAQRKQSPNLSFESSNVTQVKNKDNLYKVLPLTNPYSVTGGTWVVSKGSINYDGSTITYDGIGSITVLYIFKGNDKYNAQTVTYILNITSEDNPDSLPIPDVGFRELIVNVNENEAHEYQLQYAYNNSGVAITYYYGNDIIKNGIIKTTKTGEITIKGVTEANGSFSSTTISYKLIISKNDQKDPEISFDNSLVKENQTSNYEYFLQFVNNPHDVELTWSSNKGIIEDNVLYCEETGNITITVKSKATFEYYESTISYTLMIEKSQKPSPELSFDELAQSFNANGTMQYPVQSVNNPHNVELRWFSDRGELNSEMNPTTLTISAYSGLINIYCKSVEDDTYRSEMVHYKLYVGAARKYLQYTKHADYTIEKNKGTFDLEMLRYSKSQDLEFDPTEWTFTSSLQSYCEVNQKYYVEEDDYIVVMAQLTISKPCNPLISITFRGNDYFYSTSGIRVHVNLVGKDLLDPEISFSNSYDIVDLREDHKYLLQYVNNPHDVEIVYSSSAGTVQGNVLTYQDKYNVIIKATSIEDDTYASKTISYKLEFQEPQKPSSGIHFPLDTVTVTQNNEGIYELQGLLDAEDEPIADPSLLGNYSASIIGDITYDENRGCYILEKQNWYGTGTVKFIIYETATYRKETITYKLNILSNEKADPELSFDKYQINVTENNDNRWPVQTLNNPHNVPVTWFCTKGEFDDPNNPQYITYDKREYITISVQSEETETYKAKRQSYGMSILLPSTKTTKLSFTNDYETYVVNEEGVYPIQTVNNPYNVSPITYGTDRGEIIDGYLHCKGIGVALISASYPGDKEYDSSFIRYSLSIISNSKRYLNIERCGSVEIEGELNTDYEVNLVKWPVTDGYEFNQEDWRIYSSNFRCKPTTIRTETINGYVYLIGTFQFTADCYASIGSEFKGNDEFYSSSGNANAISITFSHPTEVERIYPSLSFNTYSLNIYKTDNSMYELQSLTKPDDVEIDYWEIDYGGRDVETAKIIDDAYVYYEGTDYIHLRVHTKASEKYKSTSIGYSMYVKVQSKWYAQIYFPADKNQFNRNLENTYKVQELRNLHNIPDEDIVWSSSDGVISADHKTIYYEGTGEITISVYFPGNDDYYEDSSSYKLIIWNKYDKHNLQYQRYGDQHLIMSDYGEYSFPLIKWNKTVENLEYVPDQWDYDADAGYLPGGQGRRWEFIEMYTQDEDDWRTLYVKLRIYANGSSYYVLEFNGNDFINNTRVSAELSFQKPAPELIDPKISWEEDGDVNMYFNSERKYLLKKFSSEYNDVEFNEPRCSTGGSSIVKEGDDYYLLVSPTSSVYIYVQNKSNNKYIVKTISYNIYFSSEPYTPKADISFQGDRYTVDRNVEGVYEGQKVRNFSKVPVTYSSNIGTIDPLTGTLTYDGDGEVEITATFEGNDDYLYTEAKYTLVIVTPGRVKLVGSTLGDQNIGNIQLNTDYEVEILRIPKNQQYGNVFTFNLSEWSFNHDYRTIFVKQGDIYSIEDGDDVVIYCVFQITGERCPGSYYTISFAGNEHFLSNTPGWHGELTFDYTAPGRIDPELAFDGPNPEVVDRREDGKYYLQNIINPYNVEIIGPAARYTVHQDEGGYYINYTGGSTEIDISISSAITSEYNPGRAQYTLKIVAPEAKRGHYLYFYVNPVKKGLARDHIYQLQNPVIAEEFESMVKYRCDADGAVIDQENRTLYYEGTGSLKIYGYTEETEVDAYEEDSYTLIISDSPSKTYLNVTKYSTIDYEVDFGEEYDIPLLKWPVTDGYEFNSSEWRISGLYPNQCIIQYLFTEVEGDDVILKLKCSFTTSGEESFYISFRDAEWFYDSYFRGIGIKYHRAPDIEVRDPQISWPNPNPEPFPYSDEHKYLIQTPTSPFPEVEFNAPTATQKVIEENGAYYVQTSDPGEVTVTISSKATGTLYEGTTRYMYASKTISYKFVIENQIIEKTDARLAFENAEETLEYKWNATGRKLYKVQPLYNPYGVPVTFRATPVGGLQKLEDTVYMRDENQTFTGYIDYGYYIEYEELADITITVRMQENDYHYCETNPSYIMHIARTGQVVTMWFSAQSVTQNTKPDQLYPIQEVMLRPDIPQIRDNVRYTLMSQSGRIVEDGGQLYLLYTGTGTVRIKATFEGDATYAGAEAVYTLSIKQSTKPVAPIDFPESDIYTPKNQYDAYPVQQPQSTNGVNYDLTGHLTWTYPSGWYRNTDWAAHMISPVNPIEDDTDVLIKCYLEETQFQEKYMQYTLHIQTEHKTSLDTIVNGDYNLEVEENTELKLELLRWPISQGYEYNSSEWSITRWYVGPYFGVNNYRFEVDITPYITCEQVDGYNVLYYNCITNVNSSNEIGYGIYYTIDINFNGNSSYKNNEWGLYIKLTEKEVEPPPIVKKDPNIRFMKDINNYTIWYDEYDYANIPKPYISYDYPYEQSQYPIEYTFKYWKAIPAIDNPTDWMNFIPIGDPVETSNDRIENVEEGYYYIECTTIENELFYSVTIRTILKVVMDYHRVDPDISFNTNYMHPIRSSWYHVPEVINNSGVEYEWSIGYYKNGRWHTESLNVINGEFQYSEFADEFLITLRTIQTQYFNSIEITCRYVIGYTSESIFSNTNNPNIIEISGSDKDTKYGDRIYDEINYKECDNNCIEIGENIYNYLSLVNWNDNNYVFDPDDWELFISTKNVLVNSNSSSQYSFNLSGSEFEAKYGLNTIYTYLDVQAKGKNIVPHIGLNRNQKIDILTAWHYSSEESSIDSESSIVNNQYIVSGLFNNFDANYSSWDVSKKPWTITVKFECWLQFKGKEDHGGSYIDGLVPWESKKFTIWLTYYKQKESNNGRSPIMYYKYKHIDREQYENIINRIYWVNSKIPFQYVINNSIGVPVPYGNWSAGNTTIINPSDLGNFG